MTSILFAIDDMAGSDTRKANAGCHRTSLGVELVAAAPGSQLPAQGRPCAGRSDYGW